MHLSPYFRDVQISDIVMVHECWPLSKTMCFNVLKVIKATGTKKEFQKFWERIPAHSPKQNKITLFSETKWKVLYRLYIWQYYVESSINYIALIEGSMENTDPTHSPSPWTSSGPSEAFSGNPRTRRNTGWKPLPCGEVFHRYAGNGLQICDRYYFLQCSVVAAAITQLQSLGLMSLMESRWVFITVQISFSMCVMT